MLNLYNEYVEARDEYLILTLKISEGIFEKGYNEDNNIKLKASLKRFKELNRQLQEGSFKDCKELKDFEYLLFDTLLFASDLSCFYEGKNLERFKMRVVNYNNKLKREELFGSYNEGKCRVK